MSDLSVNEMTSVASIIMNAFNRLQLAHTLGQTAYEGDRDYYTVLGYPINISILEYADRYERDAMAGRIVDIPAIDSWKIPPTISEDGDTDTPFVREFEALNKRLKIWSMLSRADRLSGIGRFGVVLLGVRDNSWLYEPLGPQSLSNQRDILYLRAYSEVKADVREWDKDKTSPRFGMPELYSIQLSQDSGYASVHWTRVLHLADGKLDSEIYGQPRLQGVFNLLDDMIKIVGGAAEASWLNMRPGVAVGPKEGYDWPDTDVARQAWLEEVERYAHDPLRILRLIGAEIQEMGTPELMDPSGPFDVIISLISARTNIPKRILIGSAQGELASAREDTRQWASYIAGRQMNYVEPEILRPFIDRLISLGALPMPVAGVGSYDVGNLNPDGTRSWPSIIELSEEEESAAMIDKASAVQALADPVTLELPITLDERRELLRFPPLEPAPVEALMINSLHDYGRGIRAAVRGLWKGDFDIMDALDQFISTIQRGLRRAWLEGASKAGITEVELTPDELSQIETITGEEISHILPFLEAVNENNKASGAKLSPHLERSIKWLGRYSQVMNMAMQSASTNPKLKWVLGKAEHCESCLRLANKVKRASQWEEADLRPQSPRLACMQNAKGVPVCKCEFQVTDERLSPGKLPVI